MLELAAREIRARTVQWQSNATAVEVSSTLALSTEVILRRRAARQFAGHAQHAFDFHAGVGADIGGRVRRTLLASKVDTAGEFSYHQNIDARQAFAAQGR